MVTVAVCLGGMAGAWGRYRIAGWIYARFGTAFPWGTLVVNISGSLALGLLLPLLEAGDGEPMIRAFLTVGVLGAFTTFSTFALEAVMLIEEGRRDRALAYVVLSVIFGVASFGAGLLISAGMA